MEATLKNNLLSQIRKNGIFVDKKNPYCVEVGLSGGVDSIVLAWLLVDLQQELGFCLSAVYVHHGLSSYAQDWADFCAGFCRQFNIPFRVAYVQLDLHSMLGVEAEARAKRYQVYQDSKADVIALAHHKDDQVETVFLQLLRGGGVHALSGMPVCRENMGKLFWRPLLSTTKKDLIECAHQYELKHIEDESNVDEQFRRNWVRHSLLPEVKKQVPDLDAHVLRTVSLMQDCARIVDDVVDGDLARILEKGFFDVGCWRLLSRPRQKMTLLRYVQNLEMGMPRGVSLEDFVAQIIASPLSKELCWSLPNGKIYVFQEKLYSIKKEWVDFQPILIKDIDDHVFANGILYWREDANGIPLEKIKSGLLLSTRVNGAMINMGTFHKTVKACLYEQKIPPFLRKHWPILLDLDVKGCVAVLNIKVSHFENSKDMKFFPYWRELL